MQDIGSMSMSNRMSDSLERFYGGGRTIQSQTTGYGIHTIKVSAKLKWQRDSSKVETHRINKDLVRVNLRVFL